MNIEIKLEIIDDSHNTEPDQDALKFVVRDRHVAIVFDVGYEREFQIKKEDFASLLRLCEGS